MDDYDHDAAKAVVPPDIGRGGNGYVRSVDGVPTTGYWNGTSTFVDFAVSSTYLATYASFPLPVFSPPLLVTLPQPGGTYYVQVASIANATDHNAVNADVGRGFSNSSDVSDSLDSPALPTAVTVASFGAKLRQGRVVAQWTTASLGASVGFHLYRKSLKTGEWRRVTRSLVPAQFGKPGGATYKVVDRGAPTNRRLTYRLKEVCSGGAVHWHGPYRVRPGR
jgi:hypothetical protein